MSARLQKIVILVLSVIALAVALIIWIAPWWINKPRSDGADTSTGIDSGTSVPSTSASQELLASASQEIPHAETEESASANLLRGYGSEAQPPIEDLRQINRVITGYFSVVKDPSRFPIGGNADLAAALRGENGNREAFLPRDHPLFGPDGQLIDRWGRPLIVHPLGWRDLELRSAGPDRKAWNQDDLVLEPNGLQPDDTL